MKSQRGYWINQYYADPEIMLKAQILFHEQFPDTFIVTSIFQYLGLVLELWAMGCQVEFLDYSPPHSDGNILPFIDELLKLG